jgi:hypothetical protein
MAAAEKTISALVQTQLPDFVKANHPQFKRFIELYYQWLEQNAPAGISNTAGNTIYHAMQIGDYRDIDETPDEFVRYFKDELLPYFPENPSLDIKKILKSAREYYSKKGSEESLKWLFKALYDTDLEINYPKEQILIASDGKWKKPRAFRITVGESNKNVDVNLLEKKLVVGSVSGATCIIESANRTIDETNGREIIEIYISNITKYFNNGEDIIVNYVDVNGIDRVFRERIIGTLSNVRVDSNIRTDPRQRRRGLLYNVGDPVVITGGLGTSAEANDAAALVGNVTRGSIEAVTPIFFGYGYREHYNTQVVVLRTLGVDDDEANSSTDLRVIGLNTSACTSNSQRNFLETINYDLTSIEFLGDTLIGSANFAPMTPNNVNLVLNVTEEDYTDYFENFETVWANGNNQFDALFVGKVATPNGNTRISGTVNVYSTNGTVWGAGTQFSYELKTGQTLRVDGEDQTISSITNNEHLVVSSAYSSTLTNQNAYRIGVFADSVGPDATGGLLIYDAQYSGTLADIFLGSGSQLIAANSGKTWNYNSITSSSLDANANAMIIQCLDFTSVNTGGIAAISVIDGGYGFRAEPSLDITSHYDTNWSEDYDYNNSTERQDKLDTWQTFKDLGLIAHVYIDSPGTNYSAGDGLVFVGRGYGANGYVQSVNATGAIQSIILDNRGEGYLARPEVYVERATKTYQTLTGTATVNNESRIVVGSGTSFLTAVSPRSIIKINDEIRRVTTITNSTHLLVNTAFTANATSQTIYEQDGDEATLTGYLFGDGFVETIDTSAIGRVQDIRLLYRGYDYVSTPTVSLKVVDTVVSPIPDSETLYEQEYIYQGTSLQTSTFRANVKSYNRTSNLLRLYNYSGTIDTAQLLKTANNVLISVDTGERVPVPARGILVGTGPSTFYPQSVADLPNPMYYGNGRARANAQFANGLIEFNGFFLNTDGFPSADKVLQDDTIYHNFSYIIQAEKDLIEYETTLKNISHPAGLILSAKRIVLSGDNMGVDTKSNADVFLSKYDSSRVGVLNSRSNVITGYGTDFTNSIGGGLANTKVNVGDLFILSYSGAFSENSIANDSSLRTQTKLITAVNSNTELELESNFIITGQGRMNSNVAYASITGTVATNPAVTGTVTINPALTGNVNVNPYLTGTVNVLTSNVVVGNNTIFTTELVANDIITINNQTKRVTSITNNQHLFVNSVFSQSGTDNTAVLSSAVISGNGTYFIGNLTIGDLVTVNNEIRSVVLVDSNTSVEVNAAFTYHAETTPIYTQSNVVIGSGTNFDPQINVGDIITINNEIRRVTVRANDTYLETNTKFTNAGNTLPLYKANSIILGSGTTFTTQLAANDVIKVNNEIREVIAITDNTHLTVNTPFTYRESGNAVVKLSNTVFTIAGNVNTLAQMIVAGDNVTFNIATSNVYKAQTGSVQVFTQNGKIVGTSTNFSTGLLVGDLIKVNNEIKQIVNISSATVMNVNSSFLNEATGNIFYKRATTQNANVVSVGSKTITTNVALQTNTSGLVYLIVPNYNKPVTIAGTVNASGIYVTGNTTTPNVTYFVGNVAIGMNITVNNEIRQVVAIDNNANLTVNLAFTNAAEDKYLYAVESYDYRVLTLTKDLG